MCVVVFGLSCIVSCLLIDVGRCLLLFVVGRWLLFGVCCLLVLLLVACWCCCLLFVGMCPFVVACSLFFVACYSLFVVGCVSFVVCFPLFVRVSCSLFIVCWFCGLSFDCFVVCCSCLFDALLLRVMFSSLRAIRCLVRVV